MAGGERRVGDQQSELAAAKKLVAEGTASLQAGRAEDAISLFDEVLARSEETDDKQLRREVLRAIGGKGAALLDLERAEEADSLARTHAARSRRSSDPALALAAAHRLIASVYVQSLSKRGRHAAAIAAADSSLARLAAEGVSTPRIVSSALQSKAEALSSADRNPEAIELLEALVERFGETDQPPVRRALANALLRIVEIATAQGECDRAVEALAEISRRFESDPPPGRPYAAINALVTRAWLMWQKLALDEDAIVICDHLVARYGTEQDAEVRRRVASAFDLKTAILLELQRNDETLAVADAALGWLEQTDTPELRVPAADVLNNKHVALQRLGRADDAARLDAALLERFSDASEPAIRRLTVRALARSARALEKSGENEQAIAAWRELVDRYGEDTPPAQREPVNRALVRQIELLVLTGRSDELGPLSELMIARAVDEPDPGRDALLARGLAAKVMALVNSERYEEGVEVIDELMERFEHSEDVDLRQQVALAMMNKALALGRLGRTDELEATQEDMVSRFGEDALAIVQIHAEHCAHVPGPHARDQLAGTLYTEAWLLAALDRAEEALARIGQLSRRFEDEENPVIQEVLRRAEALRTEIHADRDPS